MTPRHALNALLSSVDFHALESRLRRVSAFRILGIETREVSHAALLAWLLDPRASHGMGAEPLRRFVLLAVREGGRGDTLDAVDIDRLELADAIVETERWIQVPETDRTRRLDVLVSVFMPDRDEPCPVLVIEYKVDAPEGDDQSSDYAKWAASQPLRLGRREVLPLQVYLCPAAKEEVAPAPPFVTVGYDAYLGWLDEVDTLEKTAQARFLLHEWRACLLARNDVVDEELDMLVARIEEQSSDTLTALRTAPMAELRDFQLVLEQHDEALTQLGIKTGRRGWQSKGHSAAVAQAREVLHRTLTGDRWRIAGAGGSIRAVFLPSVHAVAEWSDSKPRYSGLCLQLWAERPHNGRFSIVLEAIGDIPNATHETSRSARLAVAQSVREILEHLDPTLPLRQRATCLRFVIEMPDVIDLESDTDENVSRYRAGLEDAVGRLKQLETPLEHWCGSELKAILDSH